MTACCLYYTAHRHPPEIEAACRAQLDYARGDIPLVAVGLEPFSYGDVTVVLGRLRPGPLTLHRQILAGLKMIHSSDWVWFCENDILYHPSHFERVERDGALFHYNTNTWRVRYDDGHAVWTDDLEQTSGLCARQYLLLEHYTRRVAEIESYEFDRHYEPGPKTGAQYPPRNWQSRYPNLDLRHNRNLTRSKWAPEEFRNQRYARGWQEADEVDGWGPTAPIVQAIKEGRYAPK